MFELTFLGAFFFLSTTVRLTFSQETGGGYKHSTVLDANGKYRLKWKFDDKTVTFELEVETTGYVGFGLSSNGAMALSDIVIGGVSNGRPYLQVQPSSTFPYLTFRAPTCR